MMLLAVSLTLACLAGTAASAVAATAEAGALSCYVPEVVSLRFNEAGYGSTQFFDFDGDGDDDILTRGQSGAAYWIQNDSGVLKPAIASRFWNRSGQLLDVDRDGDLDLVGYDGDYALIHRITGAGISTESHRIGSPYFKVLWDDWDLDGDVDLIAVGYSALSLFRNEGSSFVSEGSYGIGTISNLQIQLANLWGGVEKEVVLAVDVFGSPGWTIYAIGVAGGEFVVGDWKAPEVALPWFWLFDDDEDGDLDLMAVTAVKEGEYDLAVWHSEGQQLTFDRPWLHASPPAFARERDLDGDGRSDLGSPRRGQWESTMLLRNDGGWESVPMPVPDALDFGDLDQDGIPEYVTLSGDSLLVWRSTGCVPANEPPSAPQQVKLSRTRSTTTVEWSDSEDDRTPADALTYELMLGTTPGATDFVPAWNRSRDPSFAVVDTRGNAGAVNRVEIEADWFGSLYASVRAVDTSFLESAVTSSPGGCIEMSRWGLGRAVGESSWADIDGDGDLDFFAASGRELLLYENQEGALVEKQVVADYAQGASFAWADPDGDGDLDVAVAYTEDIIGGPFPRVLLLENRDGVLLDSYAHLPELADAQVQWGDCDGDGDEDLIAAGRTIEETPRAMLLYVENLGGEFGPAYALGTGWWPVEAEVNALSFVDHDADGDGAIFVFHESTGDAHVKMLDQVDGGWAFSWDVFPPAVADDQEVSWADVDGDGLPELMLAAWPREEEVALSGIWQLQGTQYQRVGGPTSTFVADLADFDVDGVPEALAWVATTDAEQVPTALKVCALGGPEVIDLMAEVPALERTVAAELVDVDADGRLDIFAAGRLPNQLGWISRLALNRCGPVNQRPQRPNGLAMDRDGEFVTFSWNPATDTETPSASLTYNLMVGTGEGGMDVVSPESDPVSGRRLVSRPGNVGTRTSITLRIPEGTSIHWKVQTVDAGFAASHFSAIDDDGVPVVVESFSLAASGSGCAVLSWESTQELVLERETSAGWVTIAAESAGADRWTAEDCPLGNARYRIRSGSGTVYGVRDFVAPGVQAGIRSVRPNPFNPATTIAYFLPRAGALKIELFDTRGRRVRVLVDSEAAAGPGTARWDGTDDAGRPVAGGVYHVRFVGGDRVDVRKALLVK